MSLLVHRDEGWVAIGLADTDQAAGIALVRAELAAATSLLDEEVVSASSGKKIHRLVVKKPV